MVEVPADLLAAACEARRHAHAPYSNYKVGAAVRTRDGQVFAGCNVENSAYPLSVCAERNAIAAAAVTGARLITEVVVVVNGSRAPSPCGGCRQVIGEFAGDDCRIYAVDLGNDAHRWMKTLAELLPERFKASDLP